MLLKMYSRLWRLFLIMHLLMRLSLHDAGRCLVVHFNNKEANVKVIQFRALKRAAELDETANRRSARNN